MAYNKMFERNSYTEQRPSSGFGEDRGSYHHEGVDYPNHRNTPILNMTSGLVWSIENKPTTYGNRINIKSNPKFSGGFDVDLFFGYGHLSSIDVKPNEFVQFGDILGKMGNTGNCWTWDEKIGGWRKLTEEETKTSDLGVHLHFDISEKKVPLGKSTGFLNELKKIKLISDNTAGSTHMWQWGALYYAPSIIYKYFDYLNSKFNLER